MGMKSPIQGSEVVSWKGIELGLGYRKDSE